MGGGGCVEDRNGTNTTCGSFDHVVFFSTLTGQKN